LKNFFTIQEILEKRSPENLRCFLITTHYRKPMEFSEENLDNAQRVLEKFFVALESSRNTNILENKEFSKNLSEELEKTVQQTKNEFMLAMDDDFNTPLALSHLQNLAREINKIAQKGEIVHPEIMKQAHELLWKLGSILGIFLEDKEGFSSKLIDLILIIRQEARERKDFALSDKIRDELNKLNIEVKDLPHKTIWYKKI